MPKGLLWHTRYWFSPTVSQPRPLPRPITTEDHAASSVSPGFSIFRVDENYKAWISRLLHLLYLTLATIRQNKSIMQFQSCKLGLCCLTEVLSIQAPHHPLLHTQSHTHISDHLMLMLFLSGANRSIAPLCHVYVPHDDIFTSYPY